MPEAQACDNLQRARHTCEGERSQMTMPAGLHVRHVASLAAIASAEWDRIFPGAAEDWAYFRACERAAPRGFATSAIAAYAGDNLVAAAPLFRTDYRLDTSLEGSLKVPVRWLYSKMPQLVTAKYLVAGAALYHRPT
jgi:hypothetical protein